MAADSSSKSTSSTATTAITKAEFLAKANAICTLGNAQINAAGAKLGKNPSQAQITAFAKSTDVPSMQAQINAIRALGAPSGDQATVTNMLNLAQADLNKVKSNPALLTGNTSPFADFAKIAHPYGLRACAQNAELRNAAGSGRHRRGELLWEEAVLHREQARRRTGRGIDLRGDVFDMLADGLGRDHEPLGDGGVPRARGRRARRRPGPPPGRGR